MFVNELENKPFLSCSWTGREFLQQGVSCVPCLSVFQPHTDNQWPLIKKHILLSIYTSPEAIKLREAHFLIPVSLFYHIYSFSETTHAEIKKELN